MPRASCADTCVSSSNSRSENASASGLAKFSVPNWEAHPETLEFSFVSKNAERVLGYPVEFWLGEPGVWPKLIHPDDRDWATAFCAEAVADVKNHAFEYRMVTIDGRTRWVRDIVRVAPD